MVKDLADARPARRAHLVLHDYGMGGSTAQGRSDFARLNWRSRLPDGSCIRPTRRSRNAAVKQNRHMSFDLLVYPPSGPATLDEVYQLKSAEEDAPVDKDYPPPAPEMAIFLTELERGWPSPSDAGTSPWSSWPLWQPVTGGGTGLNIRWSNAVSMLAAILEIAARTNVIVFDQQSEQVILPPGLMADTASLAAAHQEALHRAREGMDFAEQVMRELGLNREGR
jgi:hypothetical protein